MTETTLSPAELLDDHRRRPRGVGRLVGADRIGDVGSIVVGDALRFYVKTQDNRIIEARFQVFNGSEQVAAASALCALLPGKSLEEARRIGIMDICQFLGGLDPHYLPARIWAVDALRVALSTPEELAPADKELPPLLCRCLGIQESTVRDSIQVMNLSDPAEVTKATGAGSACGSCRADLPRLIDAVRNPSGPAVVNPAATTATVRGRIPTLHQIRSAQATLASTWGDGGLELWDFDGKRLTVRPMGSFKNDPAATRAAAEALELTIRSQVDPGLGVVLG